MYINEFNIDNRKSTKHDGGLSTNLLISRPQIAVENSKGHEFIARTIFNCHILR